MAVDAMSVLAIIGLVVGIIVGAKTRKPGVSALLISLTLWWAFDDALGVITNLLNISQVQIFPWIVALVANFGLGAAIWLALRSLNELK